MAVRLRDGVTALDRLRQEGCLKARFPRPQRGGWMEIVTLNSSGGVAGGDVLASAVEAGPDTHATVCGQAAERFYRALPGATARVETRIAVAEGAAVEWLPQETILFDGSALDRRLSIELTEGAWFLGVETLVFGRRSMGETLRAARLRDVIHVERAGRVALHDAIRLDGDVQAMLDRPAIGDGARAAATLIYAAPDAADRLDALRAALLPLLPAGEDGRFVESGASTWNDLLVARIVASDGACARAAIVAGLAVLRDGRPLPRVWSC